MANGSRAFESVSIASALSTAPTIYPCQIRVHQRWLSYTPTSYSSEEGVVAGHSWHTCGLPDNCETHSVSGDRAHNLPIVSPTRYQLCYRDHRGHAILCLVTSWLTQHCFFLWNSYATVTRRGLCGAHCGHALLTNASDVTVSVMTSYRCTYSNPAPVIEHLSAAETCLTIYWARPVCSASCLIQPRRLPDVITCW